jgi:hypothetical protein
MIHRKVDSGICVFGGELYFSPRHRAFKLLYRGEEKTRKGFYIAFSSDVIVFGEDCRQTLEGFVNDEGTCAVVKEETMTIYDAALSHWGMPRVSRKVDFESKLIWPEPRY